jgi:hypothetical protein
MKQGNQVSKIFEPQKPSFVIHFALLVSLIFDAARNGADL